MADRVRVVVCGFGREHHVGQIGHVEADAQADDDQTVVRLDGPVDRVFGKPSVLCVALVVEPVNG